MEIKLKLKIEEIELLLSLLRYEMLFYESREKAQKVFEKIINQLETQIKESVENEKK